jgi:adenylate cyclase
MDWRIGIHLADILTEGDDILGDGVNLAARLEGIANPGGICISEDAFRQVRGKIETEFLDGGEQVLKNIARPMRIYRAQLTPTLVPLVPATTALPLPDKPSLVVLPFQNMTGDLDQEYFVDGMVEELTTAIARLPWLLVIARNSSFTYKGKTVNVKQVAQELGVRYSAGSKGLKRIALVKHSTACSGCSRAWARRQTSPDRSDSGLSLATGPSQVA